MIGDRIKVEIDNITHLITHLQQCVDQDKYIIQMMVNEGKLVHARDLAEQTIQVEEEISTMQDRRTAFQLQYLALTGEWV